MQDAASRITPCLIADHGSTSAFRSTSQCESSHEVEIANRNVDPEVVVLEPNSSNDKQDILNFGLPFHS